MHRRRRFPNLDRAGGRSARLQIHADADLAALDDVVVPSIEVTARVHHVMQLADLKPADSASPLVDVFALWEAIGAAIDEFLDGPKQNRTVQQHVKQAEQGKRSLRRHRPQYDAIAALGFVVVELALGDKAEDALEQRFFDELPQHHDMVFGKGLGDRLPCGVALEDGATARQLDHLSSPSWPAGLHRIVTGAPASPVGAVRCRGCLRFEAHAPREQLG